MPKTREDLTESQFGRLTVVEFSHSAPGGRSYWKCRCDCGTEIVCRSDGLKRRDHVSCGCKKIEQLFIHGQSRSPEHRAWSNMIERCYTLTHKNYAAYGKRGVQVCDEWRASFLDFLKYVGERPSSSHSLDRIDNDGNYEPGNVRWATPDTQATNRRTRNQHTGRAYT